MPFSLALTAKMRHNIVKGVKSRDSSFLASPNTSVLTQKIRDEFIPGEKAKFLDKCNFNNFNLFIIIKSGSRRKTEKSERN